MKTMYDVRQLLKKHGSIVYTRDRSIDLALMEDELRELYEWKMINTDTFQQGLLILRNETRLLK
ncbi:YqgQ family protein [Halalkalibacter sp. MEB205]|uniref:YqgQ family protein n=2 Tax=Halalkalibacter alkaliphilus TaxID=2917993 RepID=A0A9X2CS71_9BACI|nr:YqgQ family protein [Halalkalibacter alkaliphilus]MCL7747181.1 YqgQ family protein [Halalkalibacter alkaliphilus]